MTTYKLTPWQNLEARGSRIFFIVTAFITAVTYALMSIASVEITSVLLPTFVGLADAVLAYLVYRRKKRGLTARPLAWAAAVILLLAPILTKYKYAYSHSWELGLLSYNSSVMILTAVAVAQFYYDRKLFVFLSYFAVANWLLYILLAYHNGAPISIDTMKGREIVYGFTLLRELFVIIISIIIWYSLYRYIPILESYERETSRQKSIIEEHNRSLERTVEERTRELEAERNELKIKNQIMENDIALARRIQDQLIPESNPGEYICSLYRPMDKVGGDFFDFTVFGESGSIGIFISDVSGHGVPAAFITSMLKTTLLQAGARKHDPAGLLRYINEVLLGQTAGNYITAFYCVFDPAKRSIVYANAGHPSPYVIDSGGVRQLPKGKNVPLAVFDNNMLEGYEILYANARETLPRDSKLLLYTDGLTENRPLGDNESYFEYGGMTDIFLANRDKPCREFITGLFDELTNYRGGDSFEDDVCMICLDVA